MASVGRERCKEGLPLNGLVLVRNLRVDGALEGKRSADVVVELRTHRRGVVSKIVVDVVDDDVAIAQVWLPIGRHDCLGAAPRQPACRGLLIWTARNRRP